MSEKLTPKDHAESVAIFRAQVIGSLLCRPLERGELAEILRELSFKKVRPPGSALTRSYAVPTLERWYYLYKERGLAGLRPAPRSDQGFAQALSTEQRALVLDIRRERPRVSATLLLRTLVADGRLAPGAVSAATVRRLLAAHDLDSLTLRQASNAKRARWEASHPGVLWHADVCHGPALERADGRRVPLRIHAILDDASRYVVAIQAVASEREVDMLGLMVKALRAHPPPQTLYLDNGSTYSGDALATGCARLEINLLHAKPYDPQARGKMERFWRTLRAGCLDHMGTLQTLHDVQVRLLAFLDVHYHSQPHGSLVGKSPMQVWQTAPRSDASATEVVSEEDLQEALTVRGRRRVKRDGTVPIGGIDWEVDNGLLAGRTVTIARCFFAPQTPPWVEHDDRRHALHRVDPKANANRHRKRPRHPRGVDAIPFDPAGALLDKLLGREPKGGVR